MTRCLATVDLGTNTVRLLVVEADGSQWRLLHQTQRVTRLGEGQEAAGRLLEGPMRRTVDTVSEFIAAARDLGASEIRVVGTSAVREAPNRDELLARLRAATGLEVQVVSGAEEARLTLQGVTAGLPRLGGSFVLFDIGGGSTELVLGERGRLAAAVSLRLGVVRLAERFVDEKPVNWERFAVMRGEIDARLAREIPARIAEARAPALVGTAGTVTTLAALDLGLTAYDADRVHGHTLTRETVEGLLRRLGALPLAGRARLPCLEPGRADVIIPGIAICLAVMGRLRHDALVVSDRGLREGILWEILNA
ncbi:MAG TPA: Ppx/GppA phosphatase family protein [Methylomirabilota bacterium]|nr:Ppx/GppA phosphatase family protein [Methylomirabilota bacterium]